jgi:hypothetical protein
MQAFMLNITAKRSSRVLFSRSQNWARRLIPFGGERD